MTICDKIQIVGETMETNLNARGVSCTFGAGTGEKNILQMANLINATNLKGSADSIINISASRPYLLSGEKTDLIVTLYDGVGTPLANKSVTVSDGTSVYSGITNNNGLFTLFDVEVSEDTTFTATYGTETATCLVEYCRFVDYGVTGNSNLTNVSTRGNVTVTNTGTLLEIGSYADIYIRPNSFGLFTAPFTVKMTITDGGYSSSTKGRLVFQGFDSSTTSLGGLDTGNVLEFGDELRCDFTSTQAKLYQNGTLVDTRDYTSTSQIKLNICNNQTGCYIKYKDLRIY